LAGGPGRRIACLSLNLSFDLFELQLLATDGSRVWSWVFPIRKHWSVEVGES
jgi:hypothetical protein